MNWVYHMFMVILYSWHPRRRKHRTKTKQNSPSPHHTLLLKMWRQAITVSLPFSTSGHSPDTTLCITCPCNWSRAASIFLDMVQWLCPTRAAIWQKGMPHCCQSAHWIVPKRRAPLLSAFPNSNKVMQSIYQLQNTAPQMVQKQFVVNNHTHTHKIK